MATTTQILYNSPALHSLKREQLVKLCKIHSLKANGKNTEIIERLKKHALQLGQETFLDTHQRDDQKENIQDGFKLQMPRPSEQWEVVMEDIQEAPEPLGTISSKGTLTSMRGGTEEFGSKTSTVSSSLRALATSLGIKHTSNNTNGSLNKHAVPFKDLPSPEALPRTEPAPLSTPDVEALKEAARTAAAEDDGDVSMSAPVPGSPSRPGAPAPANARLSMGQGPTTTIRLINSQNTLEAPGTPVLPAFQTNFDLILGSPNPTATPGRAINVWPASPGGPSERLYPAIPFEDLLSMKAPSQTPDDDVNMPGGLGGPEIRATQATPVKKPEQPLSKGTPKPTDALDIFSPMRPTAAGASPAANSGSKLGIPRSEPFLFGSPLPRNSLSNQQFSDAAQTLMQEMQRRLAEQGKDKGPEQKPSAASVPPIFALIDKGQSANQQAGSPDRFMKAHEAQFSKMDSITTHYAAKRLVAPASRPAGAASRKRKSDALGLGHAPGGKRKSSAAGARVISAGARKRMAVPGGFGADDDDDEEGEEDAGDRRSSKRVRVSELDGVHNGRRVSIAPTAGAIQEGDDKEEEEAKKLKEREAIRRRLEANKARRRSSRGRVSVGGKAVPPKAKPSRFGFFTSAKTLVKNVWNMGGGPATTSKPAPVASSSIPVAKPTQAVPKPVITTAAPPAVQNSSMRSTTSTARKAPVSTSNKLQKPRPEPQASSSKGNGTVKSSHSAAQARAPIPSFASPVAGTASSRTSTSTATSKIPSRPGSIAGASSLGMRTSLATKSQGPTSSVGTRRSLLTTSAAGTVTSTRASTSSAQGSRDRDSIPRSRTSSLLAPTASSLAKAVGKGDTGTASRLSTLPAVAEQPVKRAERRSVAATTKATLNMITNSPRSPRSPRPTKIFSQPLTADMFSSPTSQTTPIHHASLTAAATALASPSRIPTAVPPKPKGLIAKKPRISRTRVIAKVGAQRDTTQPAAPSVLAPAPRIRSSMGVRKSLGGVKSGRASAGGEAAKLAAKKRARQSEYARRRSRAEEGLKSPRGRASVIDDDAMDVDA